MRNKSRAVLSDFSPVIQAQIRAQLEEAKTRIIVYHFYVLISNKGFSVESTDKAFMARIIDAWRVAHPLIPYRVYQTEVMI